MAEIHESGEMYLETILVLKEQLGMVRSIDVAREMDFSKPSVSIGMKKLRDGGYIDVDEDGYISLTKSGMDVAKKVRMIMTLYTEIALGMIMTQKVFRKPSVLRLI